MKLIIINILFNFGLNGGLGYELFETRLSHNRLVALKKRRYKCKKN